MAITSKQEPSTLQPAYNDLIHLIDSTNKSVVNFKYVFRVFVNGTYIGKPFKASPDPTYGYGRFDVKRVIESYVSSNPELVTDGFAHCPESWASYQVKYGEEYGELSSGITTNYDQLNSSTIYVFPGAFKTLDFVDYNNADWVINNSSSKFLTNRPRPCRIFSDQKAWLGIISTTDRKAWLLDVRTYDINGNLLNSFRIDNAHYLPSSDDEDRFLKVIAGYNLNDIPGAQFSFGTPPVITDSVNYYTLQIKDNVSAGTSEVFRFNIDQMECDYHEAYDVHFLNALGWFDSIRFTRFNSKNIDVMSKDYKQSTGTLSSTAFTVSKSDKAKTQYYTEYSDKWTLRSTWLTDEESVWLEELISSPEAYIDIDGDFIPIKILNTTWEKKSRRQGTVFNLELNIEFSVKNYRQRS